MTNQTRFSLTGASERNPGLQRLEIRRTAELRCAPALSRRADYCRRYRQPECAGSGVSSGSPQSSRKVTSQSGSAACCAERLRLSEGLRPNYPSARLEGWASQSSRGEGGRLSAPESQRSCEKIPVGHAMACPYLHLQWVGSTELGRCRFFHTFRGFPHSRRQSRFSRSFDATLGGGWSWGNSRKSVVG
jgi:hypothetical protein